jgi:hypothetical protein
VTPSAAQALIPYGLMKLEDRHEFQLGKRLKGGCCGFVWKFHFCICVMKLEELQDNRWRSRDLNKNLGITGGAVEI